ncbi:hypothetical protein MNBD_ALPHA01-2381 [hydrothermal vent metagenome]|uniref:Uncharacterized protein n=1 Tax=hydrothermal vent metagenome TaxID=652676 RepID=A0A3B0S6N6_9ZZZZ
MSTLPSALSRFRTKLSEFFTLSEEKYQKMAGFRGWHGICLLYQRYKL